MRFGKVSKEKRPRNPSAAHGRTRRGVRPRLKRRIAPRPGSARRARKAAAPRVRAATVAFYLLVRFAFTLLAGLLFRHFLARLARFGQPDCDRLLAALNLLAGTAALQRALLAFLHGAFDFLGCAFG